MPLGATTFAEASAQPPPTELVQLRTQSSRTFDNHDGTFTSSLSAGPIHYRDDQGAWQPISSALVPTDAQGYAYQNEANRWRALFKQQLGPDFLGLETGGGRFKLTIEGASASNAQARARGISYPGAFSGVDLRYELLPDGVKETLRLADAQAPLSYHFTLSPPAGARMHAVAQDDGSWAFFMRPHARPIFVLEAPWAVDDNSLYPATHHATLDVTRSDGDFLLDLSIDGSWLHDPLRQFPVTVDPTITIQPAFQDASFDFNCLSCAGVGGSRLSIGTTRPGVVNQTWRSALQFSVSDIPAGASVSSAKMKLYFDGSCLSAPGGPCGGTSHQIDAYRMTSSWSVGSKASALAWNGTSLASFTLPANPSVQWMNWDITSTVQSWVAGTQSNFGLLLKRSTEPATISGPTPPSHNYAAEPTLGPKLEVTYNANGGELLEPETLHANGAELSWIPYGGPGAPPFDRYEVHRSTTASFTPSDSTRLTTIMASGVTTYRDTTAKAGSTFTYKVVVNGAETNARTVTLPAAGQTTKILRPDATRGHDTYVTYRSDAIECTNRGSLDRVKVGTDVNSLWRSLLWFDVHDIPSSATVSSATLSLWHPNPSPAAALTVRSHRVTSAWDEGSGIDTCSGDGATWYETKGGVRWAADGGDFDGTIVSTLTVPSAQAPAWNAWSLTSLVQQWLSGSQPNDGVLLKVDDETIAAGKYLDYYSSDFAVAPTLRPKLAVTYTDGSQALAPTVAIGKPLASSQVSGNAVSITAGAADDRRVDSVQFFRCSNASSNCSTGSWVSISTDSSEPFSASWDSTTVANGVRSLMARATDDAGNQTNSTAVDVSVGNAAPPTTSISSPANNANVSGTVTVAASASAGVSKVEFYADGLLVATDTTSPWSVAWNTLDPALPAYDRMTHALTAKAYDAFGQSTTSAPVNVTPINAQSTKYLADFSAITFPSRVEYAPGAPSQQQYAFDITVTNRSTLTWAANDVLLRYRWFENGSTTSVVDSSPGIAVGALLPNGSSQPIHIVVEAPPLPTGVARASYQLRFDLYSSVSSTWFAAKGNKPLENDVSVDTLSAEEKLGVEPYFEYEHEDLGAGMENLVNVATGNSIVRWSPLHAPGIGLSTDVQLTYNSMEGDCQPVRCPLGPGWSLSVSGLTRFGHQQFTVDSPGQPRNVTLQDADGTTHVFTSNDGTHWTAPAGTHLYLRKIGTQWALTSPDRVTYWYTMDGQGQHGFPDKVTDGKSTQPYGNQLTFSTNSPAEVYKIADEADRRGIANHHFDLAYNGDHTLKSISDHLGHKLLFTYETNNHHRLSDITQEGGTNADGSALLARAFHFDYETQGPLGARQLISVRDPRQHTTTFAYDSANRLFTRADRVPTEPATTFTYPSAGVTTETKPQSRVTTYTSDTDGKVTQIARQIGSRTETTTIAWTQTPPLRQRARITEPHDQSPSPGAYTKYSYNLNGLVTEQAVLVDANGPGEGDDLLTRTLYEYDDLPVPGGDPTVLAISQLRKRTDPNGAATPLAGDYEWTYTYDPNGNLLTTTDPTNAIATNHWNADGTLSSVDDANNHTTTYSSYDGNGFATQITDALGQLTRYSYDADGLLRSIQDPLHANDTGSVDREYKTVYEYDSFHRLGRTSTPKSTRFRRGTLIWTGSNYDANNNVTVERQAAENPTGGPHTDTDYDFMDRPILVTGPDRSSGLEKTGYEYDSAGRLWRTTRPNGFGTPTALDFVTENTYDQLDRVVTETTYAEDGIATRKTHNCYQDNTGDLLWLTQPNANLPQAPTNCSQTNPPPTPPGYTTRYTYDAAHRQRTVTEPLNGSSTRTSAEAYDLNGNVTSETDELATTTTLVYNQRNELVETDEVFDEQSQPARTLTSLRAYDKVGNLTCEAPPRGYDSGSRCNPQATEQYVTSYRYDAVDQLDRIALPNDSTNTQTYVHRRYDPNGDLTLITLPVDNPEFTAPPEIGDDKKTTIEYFDPGWIYSSWDHVAPITYYDYRAEGWQSLRAPRSPTDERATFWTYYDDGLVSQINDTYNNPGSSYTYDPDGNQATAVERRGRTRKGQTPYSMFSTYSGYDELAETRYKQDADPSFRYMNYGYDQNGNVVNRWDNGTTPRNGREHDFTYDESNQVLSDHDWGADLQHDTVDDQQVGLNYWPTGWEQQRTIDRWSVSGWVRKQTVNSTYFDNGDLKTVQTHNGATPTPTLLESHTVEYIDDGIYLNGNRTKDTFRLKGSSGALCDAQDCVTSYGYGPRENLTSEDTQRPSTGPAQERTYGYDFAMNLNHEKDGVNEWWYTHAGNRLTTRRTQQEPGLGVDHRYFYDAWGNLTCVTSGSGGLSDCARPFGIPTPGNLLESYAWDYLDRLDHATHFATLDDGDYEHDPLNRVAKEIETHDNGVGNRRSCFTYIGLSNEVSEEASVGTSDPCTATPTTTRSYSYDANNERVGMSKTGGANAGDYYYARNLHTDISLLEKDTVSGGVVTAAYVYKPYGAQDSLSNGDLAGPDALNAFRFNDKRLDSGSATLDMGARRYSTDVERFVQSDVLTDSSADRSLSLDLTLQNRYSFAGADPVNQVEADGHRTRPPWPGYWYRRCGFGERTNGRAIFGGWPTFKGNIYCPGGPVPPRFRKHLRRDYFMSYFVHVWAIRYNGFLPALSVFYVFKLDSGPRKALWVSDKGNWILSPYFHIWPPKTFRYHVQVQNGDPQGQADREILIEVWSPYSCTEPNPIVVSRG